MKINRSIKYLGLAAVTLLIAGGSQSFAQTQDLTIQTFDSGISGVGNWYGSGVYAWDGTQDATGNGGGSLHVQVPNDTTSDTPLNPFICMNGGNPWYNAGTVDLTLYKSIDFDIKWDNTAALTLDEFNDCSTWPATYGTPVGKFNGDPNSKGFNIKVVTPNGPTWIQLGSTNIPAAAATGWAHVSFPIDPSVPGIGAVNGVDLEKWNNNSSAIVGPPWPTAAFWIDNLVLKGTAGPPPPPIVQPLAKTSKGLNVIFNSSGQYDRHGARLQTDTGKSWVGQATPSNPVSYAFTINSFPNNPVALTTGLESYMFLIPNPAAHDNAPDWNETNCVVVYIQQGATNATCHFQYKINNAFNNAMYGGGTETVVVGTNSYNISYTNTPGSMPGGWVTNFDSNPTPSNAVWDVIAESGNLGSVTTAGSAAGTWIIKFTSDSALTMIAPDGTTTNLTFPSYNAPTFAESSAFDVYLGGQPNQLPAINQAVVYADFAIYNTVTPVYDDFLTDTTLNTNIWDTSVSTSPSGVLVVPASAAYWATWTLPATGFSLEAGSNLADLSNWTSPSIYPVIGLQGLNAQLVDSTEVPAGNAAFFNLIKRVFTQLQVLLPGETAAPGTPTGKTGTPTALSLTSGPNPGIENVTVNACDANWYPISGVSDTISLSTSDGTAIPPNNMGLVNGTVTFNPGVAYINTGTGVTITATDTTTATIPAATSSAFDIGN